MSCFYGVCLLGAGLNDEQAISTCMFSRAAVGSLIFAVLRIIVFITVIWRVGDYLLSDPAKQFLELHEKRDRREDGAAVSTNEMTFPTKDRLIGQRISHLTYFHDQSNHKFNYYLRLHDGKPVRSALYLVAFAYCIYSGLTTFAGRGYDTVSKSSL